MLEWAEIADNCPFSTEDLDIIQQYVRDPIRTLFFGQFKQYQFQIYEDLDTNYPPIIGVDVSGATWKDSSCITVLDSRTTRVTATLNCNYMPADDLAQVLYELVTKYLPNGIINIERNGGFGTSVIQRLVKTSAKKNLYWEIKDKVVEEAFNGVRMAKKSQRVRVYGLDSTRDIRARLIELLQERVRYHKDKFVAPIILDEMKHMVVKRSGKVEHSDNSHDDQVFSYLMALYVWYDGKNLAENFHIIKNTIKTDADEELLENEIDDNIEAVESVDNIDGVGYSEDYNEIMETLEFIEANSKYITTEDLKNDQYYEIIQGRNQILSKNKELREKLAEETGVDESMYKDQQYFGQNMVTLPNSLYDMDNDSVDFDDYGNPIEEYSVLQGNLSSFWNQV
jgi:hypothetical protein